MAIHGVLDRFVNNQAVILIESDNEELIIDKNKLPNNSREGTWFNLERTQSCYTIIGINEELTVENKTDTNKLMNRLKKSKKTSKFKRK